MTQKYIANSPHTLSNAATSLIVLQQGVDYSIQNYKLQTKLD